MAFNICIVRPQGYIHASAFAELAELIAYGLADLGHPARIGENSIATDMTNIVIGCHLLDIERAGEIPPATVILNTEQLGGHLAWHDRILGWTARFETWDYSPRNLALLRGRGTMPARLLRIGHHPRLSRIVPAAEADIDVLFYGSMSERRAAVLAGLEEAGLRVCRLFGVYGADRDRAIARARVVLNMHAHPTRIFEIVRASYLMANRKAIAAEVDARTEIDDAYRGGVLGVPEAGLVDACRRLVADDVARRRLEERAFATIAALPQAALLAPLLAER